MGRRPSDAIACCALPDAVVSCISKGAIASIHKVLNNMHCTSCYIVLGCAMRYSAMVPCRGMGIMAEN